jgi:hypothetical protein
MVHLHGTVTPDLSHHRHRIELALVVDAALLAVTSTGMAVGYRSAKRAASSLLVVARLPG